jgi:hypothetical protein
VVKIPTKTPAIVVQSWLDEDIYYIDITGNYISCRNESSGAIIIPDVSGQFSSDGSDERKRSGPNSGVADKRT